MRTTNLIRSSSDESPDANKLSHFESPKYLIFMMLRDWRVARKALAALKRLGHYS